MKLYELRPVDEGLRKDDNPWDPWYDYKAFGFVVRAETEGTARAIAQENAGDEGRHHTPWLHAKYSTCTELTADGKEGLIICDFAQA